MSAPEPCTATWEPGGDQLAVTCPHGRRWAYGVMLLAGAGRPLPHFLHELPWMKVPGAEWEQDDTDDAGGVWRVTVVPVSAEIADELFAIRKPALPNLG